jgi:hypothetical protein
LIFSQIGSDIDSHAIFTCRMHLLFEIPGPSIRFPDYIPPGDSIVSNCRLSDFLACTTIAREGSLAEEGYRNDCSLSL